MRPSAIGFSLLALAGCASPAPQPSASVCPSVETYSPTENAQLASELDALPPGDVMRKVADEDHRLRSELQACRN